MKIDTPILWQFQHLFRQNLSVCQNDNEIRIQLAQGLQRRCGIFALSQRQGLYTGMSYSSAAALTAVGMVW